MIVGFTTGKPKPISLNEKIVKFKELGCKAIELGLIDVNDQERWASVFSLKTNQLEGFDFVSLHAPAKEFVYREDFQTESLLDKLQSIYNKFKFKHAIIHPDRVEDWGVFKKYTFPIAIENMDNRKPFGKTVKDLRKVFKKIDVPMVLDLNHCYVNDKTLKLVDEFHAEFGNRIKEIHLSGFETLHDPLFKTRQEEIIVAIPDKDLPIIIESPQDSLESIEKEYRYVVGVLTS